MDSVDPSDPWGAADLVKLIGILGPVLQPLAFQTEEAKATATQVNFDELCVFIDAFEGLVQILGSVHWEQDGPIPHEETAGSLYTSLSALERVDVETRTTKLIFDHVVHLHDISILQEGGPYPNDLLFDISRQTHRCVSSLLHSIDQCRSRARERIQALARTKLRPLTVLDLPDELLIQIFDHVRGHLILNDPFSTYFSSDVRGIQNVRLTCRQFCRTSSHLLLDHVNIELRPESLSQLEEISRHPTIGKGVRLVRLQLQSYYFELSNDLRKFAEVLSDRLAQDTDFLDHDARRSKFLGFLYEGLRYADIDSTLEKCDLVLEAWGQFAHSGEELPGSETFVEVLRTAHREYQRLFEVQTRLLKDSGFVQAFASAIARMPRAKSLVIEEQTPLSHHQIPYWQPFYKAIHDPDALCWTYLDAFSTYFADKCGININPSMDLVLNTLAAIPGAGASLRNIKINIARVGDTALLASSPRTRRHLSVLSKQLVNASIRFEALQQGSSANMQSDFYQLLLAILDSDSLENIDISLGDIESDEFSPFDISPILNCQKRPSLSNLSLRGVAIHATELELFANSLRPRERLGSILKSSYHLGVHFCLSQLRLLSGTWAGVLDLLRTKSNHYSSIEQPSGAECEDMTEDEYDRVFIRPGNDFASSWKKSSLAERYVQQPHYFDHPNPLRAN